MIKFKMKLTQNILSFPTLFLWQAFFIKTKMSTSTKACHGAANQKKKKKHTCTWGENLLNYVYSKTKTISENTSATFIAVWEEQKKRNITRTTTTQSWHFYKKKNIWSTQYFWMSMKRRKIVCCCCPCSYYYYRLYPVYIFT